MYKKMKLGDRYYFTSNVAPPLDKLLPDELADLSISHLLMANNQFFTPFNATINSITNDELDRARLQFSHSIVAAKDKINNFVNDFEFDKIRGNMDWQTLLTHFTSDIQKDVVSLQKKCKSSPNSIKVAQTLTGALENYCEGIYLLKNIVNNNSYNNNIWAKEVQDIFTSYAEIKTNQNSLVLLSEHYSSIKENLKSMQDIENDTLNRITEQLEHKYTIDFNNIERVSIMCGNKTQLWCIVQSAEKRQEEIDKGFYQPLDTADCDFIRKNITNLYSSLDCFNKTGIVNILHSISLVCDSEAYRRLSSSEIDPQNAYKEHVQSMHALNKRMNYKLETDIRNEEEFISISKENQIFNNQYSSLLTRLGNNVRDGLLEISTNLQLSNDFTNEKKPENVLTFTKNEQNLFIGILNNDKSKMIVVYPMTDEHEGFLSAKILPNELTTNGIPSLEEIHILERTHDKYSLSCFHSFAGMIREIQDEDIQKHILGDVYQIVDNTDIKLDNIVGYKYKT